MKHKNCVCVLGIETSCDETGIAIYDKNYGLLIHQVYSQDVVHENYGGIVPELAARDHIRKVIPMIVSSLKKANLQIKDIHGIAYTAGPGLIGSLLVGASIAKALAYSWGIPVINIHHMEGHLLSPMIGREEVIFSVFPCVALLVSGAHTQLILAENIGKYRILGKSMDDAAGEVFDKIAVLLGIKYPGGSLLSKMARFGSIGRYFFPRPMTDKFGLDFSFSGLKTFATNIIMSSVKDSQGKADVAYALEDAIVDTLVIKCRRALIQTGLNRLIVSGGVSANFILRTRLTEMMHDFKGNIFFPDFEFCTDNGAMIAYVGLIRLQAGLLDDNLLITVKPRWSLETLSMIENNISY